MELHGFISYADKRGSIVVIQANKRKFKIEFEEGKAIVPSILIFFITNIDTMYIKLAVPKTTVITSIITKN